MFRTLLVLSTFLVGAALPAQPPTDPNQTVKEIAGTAEFLRVLPKPFATLQAVDPQNRTVTLLLEGDKVAKVWPVDPEAEIKVAGWWGRLEQFRTGDRIWAWLKLDRQKHPVAVAMLADEPSEQDIHGTAWQAAAAAAGTLHLRAGPTERKLAIDKDAKVPAPDQRVYFQTAGDNRLRTWTTEAEFAQARDGQKAWLRKRWAEEGLPGTLTFHHVFSGELEVMLDHEAQRWGRSLSPGDVVHLTATPPIKAVVRTVAPWRERTLVRLVVGELASADLRLGQRLGLKRTPPPEAVDASPFPPDLGRPRSPAERVEWFLASTYCTCGVGKDVCTGHFYTLASCNPNGCGQPKRLRGIIAKKIEAGLTDLQIFEDLAKELGPDLLRPHLAP